MVLVPMLLAALLLTVVPAAAAQHGSQDSLLLGYLPRPTLHSLPPGSLEHTLDTLTDLLEERTLSSGEIRLVSQLAAPTLYADNPICRRHSDIFWQEWANGSLWATAMFDATGKLPDGILAGNVNAFGSFDECLLIEKTLDNATYPDLSEAQLRFVGRYVPVSVAPSPPTSVDSDDGNPGLPQQRDDDLGVIIIAPTLGLSSGVVGMCVPSSCSSDDVRDGLQTILGANVTVTAFPSKTKEDTVSLQPGDIVVITVLTVVGVLMTAGTALDLYHRRCVSKLAEGRQLTVTSTAESSGARQTSPPCDATAEPANLPLDAAAESSNLRQRKPPSLGTGQQALIAFSVYTNAKKLLDTTARKETLTCLHGIRFLSMTWIILGHGTSLVLSYDQNLYVPFDWLKGPWFEVIVNAMPSVDTFYLLSGTLLAYGFCNIYEKTKKFNIIMFYVHRYLRLTPPLAIVVSLTATIFIYMGDGPLWARSIEPSHAACQDYWWRSLLYIQNLFHSRLCVGQSWYLATDMQMYVFSPLVLLPLVWRPLLGMIWLCVLITGFLALRVVVWSTKDLPAISFPLRPGPMAAELQYQYRYPWMRCTVWLLGIGLGYLLHRLRGLRLTLKPWLWLPGWVAAFATGVSVVYGMTGYQMPWESPSKLVSVVYGGLHRTAWGAAVAWVIFACVTGYGGPINTFLSYPGFIPLSRLSYAAYLIQINVLYFVGGSVKGTVYMDAYRLVYRLLGHVITTFAFALPLSLAFEVPFINLEKIMFKSSKP